MVSIVRKMFSGRNNGTTFFKCCLKNVNKNAEHFKLFGILF